MSRINLLPWRIEAKKIRNQRFYAMLLLSGLLGLLLVGLSHMYLGYRISVENNNINYLKTEQAAIFDKVKEIQGLQENKRELLKHMHIIQSLQSDRTKVVEFLDLLPRLIPEGVILNNVSRKGELIKLEGVAQTNTNISIFLKNLEDPKWSYIFDDPKLTSVQESKEAGKGLSFQIDFGLGSGKVQ